MFHTSGICQLIVDFLHHTVRNTKLHTHTNTKLDTKYYKPTIRQIQLDTHTNRKIKSFSLLYKSNRSI